LQRTCYVTAQEAMVRKYPRKADWAAGDLWRMLQTAMQAVQDSAALMEEQRIAIAVASQRFQTLAQIQRAR